MHVITSKNYGEALDAVRDILVTYVAMVDDYGGFGHASDFGVRFDPLRFLDAETEDKAYYVDLDLLRAGAAIAILCDLWCEEQHLRGHPRSERYEAMLNGGRLQRFPDIEASFAKRLSATPCRWVIPGLRML